MLLTPGSLSLFGSKYNERLGGALGMRLHYIVMTAGVGKELKNQQLQVIGHNVPVPICLCSNEGVGEGGRDTKFIYWGKPE